MNCNNCFTNNPDYARFCKKCGTFIFDQEEKNEYKEKDSDWFTDFTKDEAISDCYSDLGCTKDDSVEVIKKAYRKLVMKYHPDQCSELTESKKEEYRIKFIGIQKAYEQIRAIRNFS